MIETKDKKKRPPEKFFFDQNCFDEDFEEEIIEEEPPPPTFSEEELNAAQKESYEKGKKDGLAEAEASREKHVAALLQTISGQFQVLFDAEQERVDLYEAEAVALAHTIFKKLFPQLNETKGLEEIEAVIRDVLKHHKGQDEITIEVHADYSDSVEKRLSTLSGDIPANCQITVSGRDNLGPGDCRMHWNNGGAERNATFLAEEIHKQLEHILADKPLLQDNGVRDNETDQHQDTDANKNTEPQTVTEDNGEKTDE